LLAGFGRTGDGGGAGAWAHERAHAKLGCNGAFDGGYSNGLKRAAKTLRQNGPPNHPGPTGPAPQAKSDRALFFAPADGTDAHAARVVTEVFATGLS